MWDELQVVLPTGQDPYPVIDAIQKKVAEATTETAKQAEQEWQHAASSRQMSALSAAPAINVKPVIGGVEIACATSRAPTNAISCAPALSGGGGSSRCEGGCSASGAHSVFGLVQIHRNRASLALLLARTCSVASPYIGGVSRNSYRMSWRARMAETVAPV